MESEGIERRTMLKGVGVAAGAAVGSTTLATGPAAGKDWTSPAAAAPFEVITAEHEDEVISVVYENTGNQTAELRVDLWNKVAHVDRETRTVGPGEQAHFVFDEPQWYYRINAGGDRLIKGFNPHKADQWDYEQYYDDPYVVTLSPSTGSAGTEFRAQVTHGVSCWGDVEDLTVGFEFWPVDGSGTEFIALTDVVYEQENTVRPTGLVDGREYAVRAVLRSNGKPVIEGETVQFTHSDSGSASGWA